MPEHNSPPPGQLLAGIARVEITDDAAGPANDPLYVKALVLKSGDAAAVLVTVDAVAIAEIGSIPNDYLSNVRYRLGRDTGLDPAGILINASHCHGRVCSDIEDRTVRAVQEAWGSVVPVRPATGTGHEDRIMENRRLGLKDGGQLDVRHAYSLPPDEDVVSVGPTDPEIGILRLDRESGGTLAVVFNFAVHPILGVPNGRNTADLSGFACKAIEDQLDSGAIALFIQGCAGDVNPVWYKDVHHPRDAEVPGNRLGLSALRALRDISADQQASLKVVREVFQLPRENLSDCIASLQDEQQRLLQTLRGTSLDLKSFVPLFIKYELSPDYPTYASHRYLHDGAAGRTDLTTFDAENRANMAAYVRNIRTMEQLTRVQTNLNLLKKHQASYESAGGDPLEVEAVGLRVGDFVLVTFPGELSVEIGLGIKQRSPHRHTFVSGVTNGYIYYSPTEKQLENRGRAQEDSDCMLAAGWQAVFEHKVDAILARL